MSVLHQSTPPKEIIVVDDSSTDNTAEIAASFKGIIRYFHVNFRCAQQTRNFALSKTTGEYICFLDADDFFDNNALEIFETELNADEKLKLVYSGSYRFGARRLISEKGFQFHVSPDIFNLESLQQYNYIPMPSLFRKSGFPGFDPKIQRLQDWDAWLSFLSSNTDAKCIHLPLFHQRFHGKNKTLTINLFSERFKVLAKHKRLKSFSSVKHKNLVSSTTNNKITILALEIDLNNVKLVIELLEQNISNIREIVVQVKDTEVIELINIALKPYSLDAQFETNEPLDNLIKMSLFNKDKPQSEWFIISDFLSPTILTNFLKYSPISEPLIEYPKEFDWSLGLNQKSYIALNKKASQLVFSIPTHPSIYKNFFKAITALWNQYIGWRFQNQV